MNTFYISDTHFAHDNIIKYCNRPFKDTIEMDRHMIDMWNSVVTPKDKVIFGGDFAMKASPAYIKHVLSLLNGRIEIVAGNHDPKVSKLWQFGFGATYLKYEDEEVIVRHHPYEFTKEDINSGKYCLYGHVHDIYQKWQKPNMFCICVEPLNYIPRTLEQLKELYACTT